MNSLKLQDLVYLKTAVIMYKAFNNLLPRNVQTIFVKVKSVHSYCTRQQHNLHVQQANTTLRKNSISYLGVQIWNSLNDSIKCKKSVVSFKKALKLHIISEY